MAERAFVSVVAPMGMIVRSADLERDRDALIGALGRLLTPLSSGVRFNWLYRENPDGPARVWVALDPVTDALVGVSAAFPRRVVGLHGDPRAELGWVLGDFCLHPSYRTLGPALQLQRACLLAVDAGEAAFFYDFPSLGMMAVYKRLGLTTSTRMVRLARLLRVDRKVHEVVVRSGTVARGLSAAGNAWLALRGRRRGHDGVAVSLHQGVCGEEFSSLAREVGGRFGVSVQRSASYLNWRYVSNPLVPHELLIARRGGTLGSYAVFSQAGLDGTLVDLFGVDDLSIMSAMLGELVALLRERGVVTLSAPLVESHPWVPLLKDHGFVPRESSPLVMYLPKGAGEDGRGSGGQSWLLMHGDRDS